MSMSSITLTVKSSLELVCKYLYACIWLRIKYCSDFDDLDPIYMVIGARSIVYIGDISEPVVVFNHKRFALIMDMSFWQTKEKFVI